MWYREDKLGQILQEGINEAGALSSWIAAGTSYSNHDLPMIPFYIFYSMFGFQRVGDLTWAAGDSRTRGFLLGATSGRTTLNGEGLQHEDGSSQVAASFVPNCRSYDPTYGYEVAVIMQDGLRRMLADQEDVILLHHADERELPASRDARRRARGDPARHVSACVAPIPATKRRRACSSLARVRFCARSSPAPSFSQTTGTCRATSGRHELQRAAARRRRAPSGGTCCIPRKPPKASYVEECLRGRRGPGVASTDYIRTFAQQIQPFVGRRYVALGTDGYGRSDFRRKLREFFEVDRHFVTIAALRALADEGTVPAATVAKAVAKYGIDPNKANPITV